MLRLRVEIYIKGRGFVYFFDEKRQKLLLPSLWPTLKCTFIEAHLLFDDSQRLKNIIC